MTIAIIWTVYFGGRFIYHLHDYLTTERRFYHTEENARIFTMPTKEKAKRLPTKDKRITTKTNDTSKLKTAKKNKKSTERINKSKQVIRKQEAKQKTNKKPSSINIKSTRRTKGKKPPAKRKQQTEDK